MSYILPEIGSKACHRLKDVWIIGAWYLDPATCAIAGARNAEQDLENPQEAHIVLSENDLAEMDKIGRMVTDYVDKHPVMWNF